MRFRLPSFFPGGVLFISRDNTKPYLWYSALTTGGLAACPGHGSGRLFLSQANE